MPTPWIAPDEMIYGLLGQGLYRDGQPRDPRRADAVLQRDRAGGRRAAAQPRRPRARAHAAEGAPGARDVARGGAGVPLGEVADGASLGARGCGADAGAARARVLGARDDARSSSTRCSCSRRGRPRRRVASPTRARQALLVGAALPRARDAAAGGRARARVRDRARCSTPRSARTRPQPRRFAPALGGIALPRRRSGSRGGSPRAAACSPATGTPGGSYAAGAAARFVGYHAGDLALLTGVFPACALLVLLWRALRSRRGRTRASRAYLAVTFAIAVWLVLEVGVFASRELGLLAERNLIAAAPLLFLGFALWLDRGGPGGRPCARSAAAAVVVAAIVLLLPLGKLVVPDALPHAFTLIPLSHLRDVSSAGTMQLVVRARGRRGRRPLRRSCRRRALPCCRRFSSSPSPPARSRRAAR